MFVLFSSYSCEGQLSGRLMKLTSQASEGHGCAGYNAPCFNAFCSHSIKGKSESVPFNLVSKIEFTDPPLDYIVKALR